MTTRFAREDADGLLSQWARAYGGDDSRRLSIKEPSAFKIVSSRRGSFEVNEIEAELVERVLLKLKKEHLHHFKMVDLFYVQRRDIVNISETTPHSVEQVSTMLFSVLDYVAEGVRFLYESEKST